MCGISGWYLPGGAHYDQGTLLEMQASLAHRGPDDNGIHINEETGIALAHNRLSIIDVTLRARQPMVYRDDESVLIYNGEIYNFRSLRADLEKCGHRFRSDSDTEVLLSALVEWGPGALDRVEGMYAFAHWHPRQRRLFLARDPAGIKPLYYRCVQGGIVFASELKALLVLPEYSRRLDRGALRQYLEFGYTFDPERTILDGIRKLPPGCALTVDSAGTVAITPFYRPRLTPAFGARDDCVDELAATLKDVVREHLVADVPVGMLLSGGIDSSILAALAAREGQLRTFSMGFADSDIDEREHASAVSRHIGSRHREFVFKPDEAIASLETQAQHFDDLFADLGLVSTRFLYERCRDNGVKVVIVGEGADELFGGYPVFRWASTRKPHLLNLFRLYRMYAGRRYGTQFNEFWRLMRGYLRESSHDLFDAVRLFETRSQLPNNYVMKVDKASMSLGIEARVPYLDRRIADIAYRIPQQMLLDEKSEKAVLRTVAGRDQLLPPEIVGRRKFGAPIATGWLDDSRSLRDYAKQVILDGAWTARLGLRGPMEQYFVHGRSGYPFPRQLSIFRNLAWRLLLLNLWARHYAPV